MSKAAKIKEVRKCINEFIDAGYALSNVWDDDSAIGDALNNNMYPDVPSFNEMMSDFNEWANKSKEYLGELEDAIKSEVVVPYSWIKNTIGWSEFAEKTNRNVYAQKEFGFSDKELFYISKEQAKSIGYL